MRIVRKRYKLVYLVVGWLAFFGLTLVISFHPIVRLQSQTLVAQLDLGWIYLATRIFRASGEPIKPARAWWRATGRPKAGFWIGFAYLLTTVIMFVPTFHDGTWTYRTNPFTDIPAIVEGAVLAVFFLHSSNRLVRIASDTAGNVEQHAVPLPGQRRSHG